MPSDFHATTYLQPRAAKTFLETHPFRRHMKRRRGVGYGNHAELLYQYYGPR